VVEQQLEIALSGNFLLVLDEQRERREPNNRGVEQTAVVVGRLCRRQAAALWVETWMALRLCDNNQ
jgi:hypothetical protein